MTTELDRIDQFMAQVNVDSPAPDQLHFPYSRIEDPQLRVSVRVGEMIVSIAKDRNIELGVPDASDDWLLLNEGTVMEALRKYGRQTVNCVLKEVRNRVNSSDLNGDRVAVLQRISCLLRDANRSTQPPIPLPPIPSRHWYF